MYCVPAYKEIGGCWEGLIWTCPCSDIDLLLFGCCHGGIMRVWVKYICGRYGGLGSCFNVTSCHHGVDDTGLLVS